MTSMYHGWVILGLSDCPGEREEDHEVIGMFASRKEAAEWCKKFEMYSPYIILPVNRHDDDMYKPWEETGGRSAA